MKKIQMAHCCWKLQKVQGKWRPRASTRTLHFVAMIVVVVAIIAVVLVAVVVVAMDAVVLVAVVVVAMVAVVRVVVAVAATVVVHGASIWVDVLFHEAAAIHPAGATGQQRPQAPTAPKLLQE
jgi:hypothetical protein